MTAPNDLSESVIFPKGEKIESDTFIGTVWLEMLVPEESTFNCSIGNVTFEPGARNNWHRHLGGQILLVTGGRGLFQEDGKPARVIRMGDVVRIHPNVKHWHGAARDSWLVHLAIVTNAGKGAVEWLGPVTDEAYRELPSGTLPESAEAMRTSSA